MRRKVYVFDSKIITMYNINMYSHIFHHEMISIDLMSHIIRNNVRLSDFHWVFVEKHRKYPENII